MKIRLFRSFQGHHSSISALVALPREQLFVSAALDGTLIIRDYESVKTGVRIWLPPETIPRCLAAFPDSLFFACGCHDGTVLLCNGEGGEVVRTLHTDGDSISALMISQDGKRIIAGSESGTLYVWDSITGTQPYHLHFPFQQIVAVVQIGAEFLGVIGQTGVQSTLNLLEMPSGEMVRHHSTPDITRNLVADPAGATVIRSTSDGKIICSSADSEQARLTIDVRQQIHSALLCPTRQAVFVLFEQPFLAAYDLQAGANLSMLEISSPVSAATLAYNECYLITGSPDGTLTIYELLH